MNFKNKILVTIAIGALSGSAQAQLSCDKSYGFRADVGGSVGQTICDSTSFKFIDSLSNFNTSNSNYTNTSQATVLGRFNDVNLTLRYALPGTTTLEYNFAELGIAGSFTGTTRKESQKQFEDFIKNNGIIGQIMNYQALHSLTSPITGVGGLIPMTIAGDFNSSFSNSPTAVAGPSQSGGASNNLIGIGASYGSFNIDGSSDRVTTTSLPFSYTIRNDIDPRRQLSFNLPITLVEVGNSKTVHTGLGMSYRFPISDNWTIIPSGKYSAVASADRATVATLYSGSLTSNYVWSLSGFDLAMGNMIGYYKTGKFTAGEYSFNPDITNIALRNGLMLSQPVNFGSKMTIEYSLIDTRYVGGDKPFLDVFQEFGITLGTNKSAYDARSFLRGGLTYMHASGASGFTANIGYWF
jgi:hypothetical protein